MPTPLRRLRLRSDCFRAVRAFFYAADFWETDTPVKVAAPALEEHIDAVPADDGFLRTSPELHMKRLLSEGAERIFQLGPCFRRGERGAFHHPEFTLLEWYRAHADYETILADTQALLRQVARALLGGTTLPAATGPVDLGGEWRRLTVADAFRRWAGWDPTANWDADRFDLDLVEKVEPALPRDRPVILMDYPAPAAALARLRPDGRTAERWELYLGGLEIANAYSELTDPDEQRRRFAACAAARAARGKPVYPLDEDFLEALRRGPATAGGIALGLDRFILLCAGAERLADVLPPP